MIDNCACSRVLELGIFASSNQSHSMIQGMCIGHAGPLTFLSRVIIWIQELDEDERQQAGDCDAWGNLPALSKLLLSVLSV